jgi:SnoaL-like polyketide cyclase
VTPAERVVLAAIDAINAGNPHQIGELVAADLADHGAGFGDPVCAGGIRYEVHDVFSAGDRVAARATARGVHTGELLGFAATGRPFAVATMHICRVDGGRLAEHWSVRDDLTLLRQIGAIIDPARGW